MLRGDDGPMRDLMARRVFAFRWTVEEALLTRPFLWTPRMFVITVRITVPPACWYGVTYYTTYFYWVNVMLYEVDN